MLEYSATATGQYEFRWGSATGVGAGVYRYKKFGLSSGIDYTFDFVVMQDTADEAGFVFNDSGGGTIGTVNGLYLIGYSEGTRTYAGAWT